MKPDRSECNTCGLKNYTYVSWQKPLTTDHSLLIIGQAPGAVEVLTKKPFTDPAGKMLWRLMHEAELDKEKTFITNICACAPPNDRVPTDKEIEICSSRLIKEIKASQPKLILALGETALKALTGKTGIQNKRGQYYTLLPKWDYQCPVFASVHPSFVMRQRQWIELSIKDLKKVKAFFQSGCIIEERFDKPTFEFNPSNLAEILENMSQHVTAIDIETPGELDILTAKIIGIAFCCDTKYAVSLDFPSGKKNEYWEVMKRYLEDPKAKKCTQNGQFDYSVLKTNGVITKGISYDTLLSEHTLNSDLPGNLDALRARYTNIESYKPEKKAMRTIGSWTSFQRAEYNCWDVITTHAVRLGQLKTITNEQLWVLTNIEIPLIEVCDHLERKGLNVCKRTLAAFAVKLIPKVDEFEKKYFNPIGLNPRSPVQIKKLFNINTTGVEELEKLIKKKHPQAALMQMILEYRTASKALSTYIMGVYNRLTNGRIHSHPKIEGTGTGRLAFKNPNLQNVPVPMRAIYIPDDEYYSLLDIDYSQLELRVGANIAPEPLMLEEMAKGVHIHSIIGSQIFNRDWGQLDENEKLQAKGVVFGTFYGRSARSLAIEHSVSIKTAEYWQNICIKKYPGILEYLKCCREKFYQTHRATSVFGRVRVLQSITQAYNTPIQSAASDVMLLGLVELFKQGFDIRISVHDSVILHVKDTEIEETKVEATRILQRPIPQLNNYQFPTKAKLGKDWCNIKEV